MTINNYDDDKFFTEYGKMDRSKGGLAAAGEWWQLKELLPDFHDKKVMDLGCGYGRHCKYAAQNGASEILGSDSSSKMLVCAQQINNDKKIKYRLCSIEEYEYPFKAWIA